MINQKVSVHAIINPISGVGSKRAIPRMIENICSRNDHALTISFTEYAGHASVLTQAALDAGADYIIAVGGDGTVNEIARAMLHSRAILGIVPKGSGNGLARELHIPMDSKKALEVMGPKYQGRNGGYTRIIKLTHPQSGKSKAVVEFVD